MYKKLLLVLLSIITIQTAKAQTEKGSQNLGLTFGVSTTNTNARAFNNATNSLGDNMKIKLTTYSIVPEYNYFIANKLDIGVGLGYSYNRSKSYSGEIANNDQIYKSFFSTISLRKYFLFDNKIGIRTGPYLSYGKSKQSYEDSNNQYISSVNSDIYGGGLGLDFVYYPAKNIGLAAGLGKLTYFHQKDTGSSVGTSNTFNLSFVDNLSLSVYYVFGK